MSVVPESNKSVKSARRSAAPRADDPAGTRRSGRRSLVLAVILLFAGIVIGALLMRERYKRMADEVVVSVNGSNINKTEFYRRLEMAAGPQVIRQMVREQLVFLYAKQVGAMPSDADLNARLAQERKKPDFKENLARSGRTVGDFKRDLRMTMAQAAVLNRGVNVTDAEIHKFYEINTDKKNRLARYYKPESVRIAVIATKSEANAKKAASELRNGIPWATVVKKYSQDASKANDGVLPPSFKGRSRANQVPGLEETIFGMKIGQQVGPMQFAKAWWIIRCLDKELEKTVPFEQVRDECRTGAMLLKGLPANAKKTEEGFVEFQKKANIQAFWPQYKAAVSVK